jgi:hypothetical protein
MVPTPPALQNSHTDMDATQHDQDCTLHTAPGLLFVHHGYAPKLNCSKLVGDARATVTLSPAKLKGKAVAADWDDSISVKDKDIGVQKAPTSTVHPHHKGLLSRRISSHGGL